MKKLVYLFSLLCIFALITLFARYESSEKLSENLSKNTINITNSEYILRSENNQIRLYKADKLIKSYDISPDSLPLTDRDNLRSGIILKTYDDVLKIIEDFDG